MKRARFSSQTVWAISSVCLWLAAIAVVRVKAQDVRPAGPEATKISAPAQKNPAPAKAQAGPAIAPNTTAKYVGEETCLTCHDNKKQAYVESKHHRAVDPRTPAAKQGCETCHGPGSEHASDPVNKKPIQFTKLKPDQINATCTTCHNKGEHALWDGSQHEARGLACTTCHSIHSYKSETAQLKGKTQMEVCATCHRDKVSKVDRSGHMPVREGKLQCTTCHNIHGSTNVKLLRKGDSVAEMCTSCHADKRGPFLWEHAPSRDGCTTCHDPHGSSNERMLVAKPPLLCQRCHVGTQHPSTVYDATLAGAGVAGSGISPSIRVYARSCVTCHSAIHGSNHPSGQRFIR